LTERLLPPSRGDGWNGLPPFFLFPHLFGSISSLLLFFFFAFTGSDPLDALPSFPPSLGDISETSSFSFLFPLFRIQLAEAPPSFSPLVKTVFPFFFPDAATSKEVDALLFPFSVGPSELKTPYFSQFPPFLFLKEWKGTFLSFFPSLFFSHFPFQSAVEEDADSLPFFPPPPSENFGPSLYFNNHKLLLLRALFPPPSPPPLIRRVNAPDFPSFSLLFMVNWTGKEKRESKGVQCLFLSPPSSLFFPRPLAGKEFPTPSPFFLRVTWSGNSQ